jgi:hypothetical protein
MISATKLLKKGWHVKELRNATEILERSTPHDKHISKIVFWSALVVTIIGNIIASLVLIPFLAVFTTPTLYFFVGILAFFIGFLYNFLIQDIWHLKRSHHIIGGILLPLIAIVNIVIVVLIANSLKSNSHNPWIVAIIFASAFILPSIIDNIRLGIKHKKDSIV